MHRGTAIRSTAAVLSLLASLVTTPALADPFPPYWGSGSGPAVHFAPVAWPAEPADPKQCGATCGDWRPYTRFQNSVDDPRVQDPSNGGTAPQNYVNIASSCLDKTSPSIYYALRQGAAPDGSQDVIMFRWRVEQIANNFATGPSAGTFGATDPWSSALWTVLFDINGDGYADLAAHLDGSSGAPATAIDRIAGIWSKVPTQSLDYIGDPNVKLIAHNPTAFVDGPGGTNRLLNFQGTANPVPTWPNGAAETSWDYGATRSKVVTTAPCNEFFIDYQIPVQLLDASGLGGPKITRTSPISMIFCTANSLNNPFQKDCAINKAWIGSAGRPAPFGDYVSFNQTEPYRQPIISGVTATAPSSCPGAYALSATVQDTLAVVNGIVVPSVKSVSFWYYYDADGNGLADDGTAWTFAADASLRSGTLNTWIASWDASGLARGQYLIGVQALDDDTKVDDGTAPSGVDNRTFSYVAGDADNRIHVGGTSFATLPAHSPAPTPTATEDWWGNPSVTGTQTALVGLALNTCGPAPTLIKSASAANLGAGGTVDFTLTVSNPPTMPAAITLSQIDDDLPPGFSYVSTLGTTGTLATSPAPGATGVLTWTFDPAVTLGPGATATLFFRATASVVSGNYNNGATAATSFGPLTSAPVAMAVDSARLSLAKLPSTYSISPDGTTPLVYTLAYANDSSVMVTGASITDTLPAGVSFVGCSGGTGCSNASGTVTWTLGSLAGGAAGTATLTVTVNPGYSSSSLANVATLAATDPGGSLVSKTASSTIAVTVPGVPLPAAFMLSKTSSATQVAPGAAVTWALAYTNYGGTAATGVALTDVLPAGFTFAGCSGSCTPSGSTITWSIGSVAAGASGSVTVTATADNPFEAPNPATNAASLTWAENTGSAITAISDIGVTGNACSDYFYHAATTSVGAGADGGTQRIATTTAPTGAATAVGPFIATTTPAEAIRFYQDPPATSDVSFSGDIVTSFYVTKPNGPQLKMDVLVYDYDPSSGNKTLLGSESFTQMGGGTNTLFTFTLPLSGTLTKGHRILWVFNAYSNNSTTFTFNFDGTASQSGASFCVTPPANLTLAKTVDTPSVTAGTATPIQYTLHFANTGQTKATGAQVVDTLPTGVSFVSALLNGSAVVPAQAGQQLTFGNVRSSTDAVAGEVSGGASGTILINATVGSGATGTLANIASLSSNQTSAVTATATTTAVTPGGGGGSPMLAIALSADKTTAGPGDTVTYTVTVVNIGTAGASNVQISTALPVASYYVFGACPAGSGGVACTEASGTLTWNVGALAAGASATYSFTMVAGSVGLPPGVTVLSDTASASATGVAAVPSNTVDVTLNGNPTLTVSKSADPTANLAPGDTVTYTIAVTNDGSATASGVVVTDPIPAAAVYLGNLTTSAGSAAFDAVDNQVVWSVGSLASAATATLHFDVSVGSLPTGPATITNTATASADNAAARSASAGVSAGAAPVLTLVKQAPAQVALPAASLVQAANDTTLFVDDPTHLTLGRYVSVGGSAAVQVLAVTGNAVAVSAPVIAALGALVVGDVTYGLSYANSGTATATGVTLTDALPAGVTFITASGGGNLTGTDVVWSLGNLDPGSGGSVQVTVIPGGAGTLVNQASITCGGCNTPTASATTAAGGLVVTKRTTTPTAMAGATATYVVEVENTAGAAIAGVTVTDALPPGFSYASTTSIANGGDAVVATTSPAPGDVAPSWGTFTVQPGTVLAVTFVADISPSAGAATYQNDATAAPAGSTVAFDPLGTTADDVVVLAPGTGVVDGYVFQDSDNDGVFNPAVDTPLVGVSVEITDSAAGSYVAVTDPTGRFTRVVAAGLVTVDVVAADLPAGLTLGAGFSDPATVSVPSGGTASKNTGYVLSSAVPDLTIAKAHAGSFSQGQSGATYSLTVTNAGPGPTVGAVTVSDTLPAGLVATAIAGTGWSCLLQTLSCTRSDSLAAGQSYPAITLTVTVAGNAAASVINLAFVSGGGETNAANNQASDPTTITPIATAPDLTIAKSHVGPFTQGQTGATYTLTVSNVGAGPTTAPVTVTDALPAGLTSTAISGAGWSCILATVMCTRSDALAAGSSYPVIVVSVNVAIDAASSVINTTSVSGGGDGNAANNSASDPTTISPVALTPDLTIAKSHTGNFTRGQSGATYTLTVRNQGSAPTAGPVTVSDVLPAGLTATSLTGPGWSCALNTLTCTRGDALAAGQSYPAITLTVSVAADAASTVDNTASVSGGGETNTANNSATDPTTIGGVNPAPDLVIAKHHAGNLTLGQIGATYTLSVSNAGSTPTVGPVTVTDALPAGLTATDIAGAGWTCVLATLSCTRGDALAAGSSYPGIVVTVNVAVDAAASLTNSASVSGGGDADGSNNAASDPTTVEAVRAIPVLGPWGLAVLTTLIVWVALRRLARRRPLGS